MKVSSSFGLNVIVIWNKSCIWQTNHTFGLAAEFCSTDLQRWPFAWRAPHSPFFSLLTFLSLAHIFLRPVYPFHQTTSPWWYVLVLVTIARSTTSGPSWTTPRKTDTGVPCWTTWVLFPTSSSRLHACSLMVRTKSFLQSAYLWC